MKSNIICHASRSFLLLLALCIGTAFSAYAIGAPVPAVSGDSTITHPVDSHWQLAKKKKTSKKQKKAKKAKGEKAKGEEQREEAWEKGKGKGKSWGKGHGKGKPAKD